MAFSRLSFASFPKTPNNASSSSSSDDDYNTSPHAAKLPPPNPADNERCAVTRPAPAPLHAVPPTFAARVIMSSMKQAVAPRATVRVATFNVLADAYARPKSFEYAPPEALRWRCRRPLLFAAVERADADIVALQEADPVDEWDAFFARAGYDTFHAPRPGSRQVDRCVLAWRRDRLRPVLAPEAVGLNLSDLGGCGGPLRRRLNKDNQGVLVALAHRAGGAPLVVACAHLHWNPANEVVKALQAAFFARAAAAYRARAGQGAALVLCGDLNSQPGGDVYQYLVSGRAPPPVTGLLRAEKVDHEAVPAAAVGEAAAAPPPFALDSSLRRAAKTLRRLGCDAELFEEPRSREAADALFARCRAGGRAIVTQSAKLLARRGSPANALLLPPRVDRVQAVQEISRRFGLDAAAARGDGRDPGAGVERRCGCGGANVTLPADEALALPFIPEHIRPGVTQHGEKIRFTRCDECGFVTWWTRAITARRRRVLAARATFRPSLDVLERREAGAGGAAIDDHDWEWLADAGRGEWRPFGTHESSLLDAAAAKGAARVRLRTRVSRGNRDDERTFEVDLVRMMYAAGGDGEQALGVRRRPRRGGARGGGGGEAGSKRRGHVRDLLLDGDEWRRALGLRSAYADYRGASARAGGDARRSMLDVRPGDEGSGEPEFTNFTASFRGTLDYIMFSGPRLRLARLRRLPDEAEAARRVALPSVEWPSDHLLLAADFELD